MKHLVVLFFLFFAVAAFADDLPAVSARQALDAGEKDLADRGLDKEVYIESVSLAHATIIGGEIFWLVKWSHPIAADKPNQREIGLKVTMDGKVMRMVKALGKP